MNGIYDQCRRRLTPEELNRLAAYERSIEGQVQEAQKVSDTARKSNRRFVTAGAEAAVKAFEGVQKEAGNFNFASLGKGPNAPKQVEIPDAQRIPLFIQSRIGVAKEHIAGGRFELATSILEDVLKTYPTHPDAQPAKDILRLLQKAR